VGLGSVPFLAARTVRQSLVFDIRSWLHWTHNPAQLALDLGAAQSGGPRAAPYVDAARVERGWRMLQDKLVRPYVSDNYPRVVTVVLFDLGTDTLPLDAMGSLVRAVGGVLSVLRPGR